MSESTNGLNLLIHPRLGPPLNMAVDWWLLNHVNRPTLRFYGWPGAVLTVGYRQQFHIPDELYRLMERWPTALRPTGGGYLMHAGELTYSLVVPSGHSLADQSIMGFYGMVRDGFADSLVEARLLTDLEMGERSVDSADCLEGPADHEPTLEGDKWMAAAQVRHDGNVLQHGSLYYDSARWPDDWPGNQPSFIQQTSRSRLIEILVNGLVGQTNSIDCVYSRPWSKNTWNDIGSFVDRFTAETPDEFPVFRRSVESGIE